jgi:hypothetical protein
MDEYLYAACYKKNSLVGDCCELARSVHELLPSVVRKLENRDEVTYTETEAHCKSDSLVILHKEGMRRKT